MKRLQRLALVAMAGIGSPAAHAFDFFDNMLRIEGFGTLGAFSSDLNPAVVPGKTDPQVRADVRENHGSVGNQVIWDADTLLSVQATVNPNGPVKGVVQLLSKQNIHASQKPAVEWAYGSWQATSNLDLRLGRVVAPIFMLSDTRNVAYAQTMVRPFTAMYPLNPVTNIDGGYFLWEDRIGGVRYNVEGMDGHTKVDVVGGDFTVKNIYGLASKWTLGDWSARVGWSHLNYDVNLDANKTAQINAVRGLCDNCSQVIDERVGLEDQRLTVYTVGGQWEHDDYLVMAEYAARNSSSLITASLNGYYVMGARRFGAWTPFAAWGRLRNTEPSPGLSGPTSPAYASTIDDLNDARAFGRQTRTETALGIRWDFMPKADLKFQWGHIQVANPRNGTGANVSYSIPNKGDAFNGRVNTYTLNLDFIF